jgi:PAS domain S-box-containing protein
MKIINKNKEVFYLLLRAFLLGMLFPIVGFFICNLNATEPKSFLSLLFTNYLYTIVCLAPIVLPIIAYLSSAKILKYFDLLNRSYNSNILISKKNTQFVTEIGSNNFSTEFRSEDKLGEALSQMRENLITNQLTEDERNWITNGTAEVGTILRKHTLINEVSEELIVYLSKKIEAVQCAFYVVDHHAENKKLSTINMVGSYAFNRKKNTKKVFQFGQGLVGQAVAEADYIYRTEIPDNYMSIKSGLLGDKKPTSILIAPLITNEKVYGVLELASLNEIKPQYINFINTIGDIVARTIFNITINEQTLNLLHDSQKMGIELKEQSEQLRESAENMQVAKENLEVSNAQLEEKIIEVNNAQKLQNALLENASEVISIYTPEGNRKYESPSMLKILGYNPSDTNKTQKSTKIYAEDAEHFSENFTYVKDTPHSIRTFQFRYIKANGDVIWLESTLRNMVHDEAVNGLVMNSRDITEKRVAEEEQRMRAKMQALSENSLDLITRIDIEGTIVYINPIIEIITTHKPDLFLQSNYTTNEYLPKEFIKSWDSILLKLKEVPEKISFETKIQTAENTLIYLLNAIPEFDTENNLETILIVAHDITEQKATEELILDKNKKITESINYSYRIQSSLMPTEDVLKSHFPNSCMFYKPKDIVSGDFPYIYQIGDIVYIAAVDCTGHGVPGALMSFIGYFSLNQIMSLNTDLKDAAKILDLMHAEVQQKLKQDTGESESKDGMDVALVKINIKTLEVDFAGAHRSLYLIKDNVFEEVKADKYPIAGMHYKTRQPFKNNHFKLKKGDSFIFNTDGLPDQFGGVGGKQKFMSKKVRDIIEHTKTDSMTSIKQTFDREFTSWQGPYKQMDDVLLIGIKF